MSELEDLDQYGKAFDAVVALYAQQTLAKVTKDYLHMVEDTIVAEAKQYHGTAKGEGLLRAAEIVRMHINPEAP